MSIPPSMRAWIVNGIGAPKDVLKLELDTPAPAAPKGANIMVKVWHAAINPMDIVLMNMRNPFRRGAITAVDFAGELVQAGPDVSTSDFKVGMTVCGMLSTSQILCGYGTLAEYIVLPANMAAEKPRTLNSAAAAGSMGVAGQSCVALLDAAGLSKGSKVVVNGASGGVGCLLVQVLQAQGHTVVGICSKANQGMVERLGASEIVDYTAPGSLYDRLSIDYRDAPFNVIFDCVGDEILYKKSTPYLKTDGRYLTIAGGLVPWIKSKITPIMLGGTPRYYVRVMNKPSGKAASEVASWFEKGWIKEVPIDSIYPMEEALEAFEKLSTKRARGKIIVELE